MPDDELFDLAARGKLRDDLDHQVRRMLGDPKSKALVENFAGQWLQLRNLDLAAPDKSQFPAFDAGSAPCDADRVGNVLRGHRSRGPLRAGIARRRLYVRQCEARAALRTGRHRGRPVPPGIAPGRRRPGGRERPRRRAHAGRDAHGDVESFPDLARKTRQVGLGKHPRHTAARSAARMFPCCRTMPKP